MMVDDHTRTSNEVRAVLAQHGVQAALPGDLDEPRRNLINQLNSATAEDFDDRYIDQQIEAHQNVLALIRDFAQNGDNEPLKAWAGRTAPAIENHLQMARGLKRNPAGAGTDGAANDNAGAERR
jgi:putative membrane protein